MAASNIPAISPRRWPPAPTSPWSALCWPALTRRRARCFCGRAAPTSPIAAWARWARWRAAPQTVTSSRTSRIRSSWCRRVSRARYPTRARSATSCINSRGACAPRWDMSAPEILPSSMRRRNSCASPDPACAKATSTTSPSPAKARNGKTRCRKASQGIEAAHRIEGIRARHVRAARRGRQGDGREVRSIRRNREGKIGGREGISLPQALGCQGLCKTWRASERRDGRGRSLYLLPAGQRHRDAGCLVVEGCADGEPRVSCQRPGRNDRRRQKLLRSPPRHLGKGPAGDAADSRLQGFAKRGRGIRRRTGENHGLTLKLGIAGNLKPSLRANGSRECAPHDKLREAIQFAQEKKKRKCFVA